jgi:hypothetical protein
MMAWWRGTLLDANRGGVPETVTSAAGSLTYAQYSYLGQGTVVSVSYPTPEIGLDYDPDGDSSFAGWDELGRVVEHSWLTTINQQPSTNPQQPLHPRRLPPPLNFQLSTFDFQLLPINQPPPLRTTSTPANRSRP